MKAFTFAAVAAFATTAFASTVKLEEKACLQSNATAAPFDVEVDKLTAVELPSVCGLKIVSAEGVDAKDVKCQAYKDAKGQEKGSAEFTVDKDADIATNPVQINAILCIAAGSLPTAAVPTSFAVVSTSAPAATGTGSASPSGGNTTSPTSPSNPIPSGGPGGESPGGEGSASTMGMSFGALAGAALAMLFL